LCKNKLVAAFVFSAALMSPAFAQSSDLEEYALNENRLAEGNSYFRQKCKNLDLPVKFDWSTYKDIKSDKFVPYTPCLSVLNAVGQVCDKSEDALKAVQSSLKSLTCKQASPHVLTLENGELIFGDDENDFDVQDRVLKFLMEKL
jgi:hypothetical protein